MPCVIATFNENGFYSQSGNGHTAMYLGQSYNLLWVFDQNWDNVNGRLAIHAIEFKGGGNPTDVRDASNYYIVQHDV